MEALALFNNRLTQQKNVVCTYSGYGLPPELALNVEMVMAIFVIPIQRIVSMKLALFALGIGLALGGPCWSWADLSPNWEAELVQEMNVCGGGPLIFDQDGKPIIAYPERSFSGSTGILRLARRGESAWELVNIDTFPSSMAYAGMPAPSLALSPTGIWGLSYCLENADDQLSGEICLAEGTGLNFTKEAVVPDWSGAETTTSLGYTSQGNPVIAYVTGDPLSKELRVAIRKDGTWSHVSLTSDIIGAPTLAIDREGHILVGYLSSYYDGHFGTELILAKSGQAGGDPWIFQSVRQSGEDFSLRNPSIALNQNGLPALSYVVYRGFGGTHDDTVEIARFDGHSWNISPIDHSSDSGIYHPCPAFGKWNDAYVVYTLERVFSDPGTGADHVYSAIRFAKDLGSGWDVETVDEGVDETLYHCALAVNKDGEPCLVFVRICSVYFGRYQGVIGPQLAGDFDGDKDCDGKDLTAFAAGFGSSTGDAGFNPACDLHQDGVIDEQDLEIFGNEFGQ
ncbi:MAG: hypothetical protein JRF59_10390 [Deltaproteobacteria bacterium]|nr:hypothetical protein [Deltaproteobacteria bacterium]